MVLAAQTEQNAQAGYAADYQNKRSAQSFNEVKEAKKGHHALADKIGDKRISYIGHRHVTRTLSDYYGRGIVRSNQERTNLRAYCRPQNVTSAEAINTNKNVILPAAAAFKLVERKNGCVAEGENDPSRIRMEYDDRDVENIRIVAKSSAYLYGFRPLNDVRAPELAYLSLYEFFRYWRIELAAYVISDGELANEQDECYHARLTLEGCKKLSARKYGNNVQFVGGRDYVIKEEGCSSWIPFPNIRELDNIRQTWILVLNERPKVPSFCKAPMPDRKRHDQERNARIVMTYFHPWTLQEELHIFDVPHVSCLRRQHESWEQTLLVWLNGNVLTHEARNTVHFFLCVTTASRLYPRSE